MPQPQTSPEHLSAADILSLVREHLPAWMRACEATDTDAIALHEAEFGTSATELILFACAIKFAAKKGKNVYVTCDGKLVSPKKRVRSGRFVAVYREMPTSKPLDVIGPKSKRPA
jgi:hypothetical protein